MKFKTAFIWIFSLVLIVAGFSLSVVRSNGWFAFTWQPNALMAQQASNDEGAHELAALEIFNRVLLQLQVNYVDVTRFEPNLMLVKSLDEVQKSVPELLLTFDRPLKDSPTKVAVKIGTKSQEFDLSSVKSLWEMSLKLKEILQFIQGDLPKDVKTKDLEYVAINGMLSTLDPHSMILSSEVYKDMSEGNRGKFGGLGILVRMIDGVLVVMQPMPGEPPAVKAGMKAGDQILSIDDVPTLNMNIQEAVDLLKGEPDTTVKLSVMRKGWKEPRIFKVIRDEISIASIESADLGDKIAYIKIKGFQSNSQADLLKALSDLNNKMGSISALVMDLRGNPGGLLDQAVMIADDFLDKGVIVTTEGASKRYRKPYEATEKGTQAQYPIAVLIDSSSASASEIVAGALKNLDRALIMGETSFGKGSVQVLYELQDKSALKLTIAQYLTPGDQSIQSVGIVPDIKLQPMRVGKDEEDIYSKAWVRRENSLGGHLDNEKAIKDLRPSYTLRYLSNRLSLPSDALDEDAELTLEDVEQIIANEPKDEKPADNPEVILAKKILLAMGNTSNRPEMLKLYAQKAPALQAQEDTDLAHRLKDLGINWEDGTNPQNPQIAVRIQTDNPDNHFEAGQKYSISVSIQNLGQEPLYRIVGISDSSLKRVDDKEFIFGKIEPQQSVTRKISSSTSTAQKSRIDYFNVKIFSDNADLTQDNAIAQAKTELQTTQKPQPYFSINYAIIDSKNGTPGNSLLDDDEDLTLRVWVANTGQGDVDKPLIFLKNKGLKDIQLKSARIEPKQALKVGDVITQDFTIQTKKLGTKPQSVELHIYDKKGTQMLVEKIALQTSRDPGLQNSLLSPERYRATTLHADTPLMVSPLKDANSLTKLPQNTVLDVSATLNGYSRVSNDKLLGWVSSNSLQKSDQALTPFTQPTITTIPRILLDPTVPLKTSAPSINLRAQIQSNTPLKDFYIFAITEENHQIQAKKIAYDSLKNSSTLNVDVPLIEGVNRLRVFVRDEKLSEAYETLQVYRAP